MVSTLAPSALQKADSVLVAAGSVPSTGVRMHQRLTKSSAKPASGPEFSVPATGCAGMKCTPFGTKRRHVAHHRALDRADVGEDRAGLQMRPDLLGHRPARADRNRDDDEIGVLDRLRAGLGHLIGETEFGHALARFRRARGGDNGLGRAGGARGARDRAADQAGADQRKALHDGFGFCHDGRAHLPMNSASVFTVRRLASSDPTVIRSAFGR